MIEENDIDSWLDAFFVKYNITFSDLQGKVNFKKYYIYHSLNQPTFPIEDSEYRPEFRNIREFIDSRTKIDLGKVFSSLLI